MGLWSIVIPESAEVTNLVTNPSAETGTTGWTAISGGTLAQSSAKQRRGYASLSYTSTTAIADGITFDSVTLASGTTYTLAFDFWGASGVPYIAYFADTAGTKASTQASFIGANDWQREAVTYSSTANAEFRLYITKNDSESTAAFYVDGVSVVALDHDTGHIDGDQPDCRWTGTAHASTSIRKAGSREGGEVVNFDDFGFYIHEWPGAGMAEVEPLTQEIGLLPGELDAGEKVLARPFSLVGTVIGSSQSDLHSKRKAIINAVKSDRVKGNQQPWIVYSGANSGRAVRVKAKYIGGLTMGKQDGFSEKLAMKFLATSPFWHEDGEEGAALVTADTVTGADYIMRRVGASWYSSSAAFNGFVSGFTKGKDGKIYICGNFTDVGDTNGAYITSWNGSALASLGSGLAGSWAYDVIAAPNGNIYVGGPFTSAGGVANTQGIACWDTSTSGWKSVGGGITTPNSVGIYSMAFDNSGNLYAAGGFTNQADANGDYVSCYSATGWGSLGTGMNGIAYTVAIGPDGYPYFGGAFTTGNGVTLNGIGRWNGTTFEALGSGVASDTALEVRDIVFDDAGNLYACGLFNSAGGVSANNIAMWNGRTWSPLGSGLNSSAQKMAYHNGLLYVVGGFSSAGGINITEGIAIWNGSSWAHMPVDTPSLADVRKIFIDGDDLYIGHDGTRTAYASYKNTLTNGGTAKAYPKFTFACNTKAVADVATVAYLKNEVTGATIWLNYALQDGETLTLDFSPFNRSITSSARGNVIGSALLRNSDFADFYLLPGDNDISVYVIQSGTPTVTAYATWPVTHWSNDGSAA